MASPSPRSPNGEDRLPVYGTKVAGKDDTAVLDVEKNRRTRTKTPEPAEQRNGTATPNPPAVLEPFDWDDFEARYEKALAEAEGQEREVLKEAESLFRYFEAWSSAASAHDDKRAVKRLQTRQRYINISEQRMAQKQQHYDEMSINELPFKIPQITSDELLEFQRRHFSSEAAADFGQNFTKLPPQESSEAQLYEEWEEEEEDDGLGYYEDGVKRTLTDEQIAIFRHSELRELRKQQEKQFQSKSEVPRDASANETDVASPHGSGAPAGSRNKKKKKKSKAGKQEPKPDLRKRTWDVVEAGLDTLDYD
ncbi:hypothetical protein HDV62DRAFT_384435 [Trichoderma sp. SZMC 28011]